MTGVREECKHLVALGLGREFKTCRHDTCGERLGGERSRSSAERSNRPSEKSAWNCTPNERPLASSAPRCLMWKSKSSARELFGITIASPKRVPAFVPPIQKMSASAGDVGQRRARRRDRNRARRPTERHRSSSNRSCTSHVLRSAFSSSSA